MIDPPQYEKLRVVTVDEEEAAEYEQQLYFEVPRKTGNQMAPRIDVIKHMRKFDQQKKIRILRKMMKRARVPKVGKQTEILLNMDKSEGIVPHGEVSKRIYNEIFHSREFDLYGRPIHRTGPIEYNVRKEKELRNKAFELGIEYKNLKQEEIYKASLADPDKDNVPDIFADNTKDLKKPQISTELWKIGFADTKIAPIGLKEDPGKIYKSRGNEKFFSYDGEWDKGRMHGDGRYKYLDGHEYVGRFQNDWPHGIGTATYPMGGSFRGEWVKGRYGTLEQSSKMEDSTRHEIEKKGSVLETCIGSVYEGEFSFGRRDGKGKITFPSGLIIEGTFLDGQPSGRCKVTSKLTKYSFEGNFNK